MSIRYRKSIIGNIHKLFIVPMHILCISEEQIRERSGQTYVAEKIRYHRWRWYGHVMRMPENKLPRHVLDWTPEESRRMGPPKDTWRCTIAKDKREKNITIDDEALA